MNFSLEQLLAFVSVYEQLSFSKAAVKLNKHRTTIGQVITNLEDQLAVTLFDRIGRSVEPTEDGKLLYHYAKQALEQARVFDKVALSLSYGGMESITIAYSSILPHQALSQVRLQLAKDFPTMRVNFLVRTKSEIQQGIEDGTYDCGLVNVYDSTGMKSFDAKLLGHLEFVPFVHKGSDIAKLPTNETVRALRTSRQLLFKGLVDDGMKQKVVISSDHEEIDQLALVIELVQNGVGWSLLPKLLMESTFYNTDNLEIVYLDEMMEGLRVPISFWCPYSKQIALVKKSISAALENYIHTLKQRN